MTGVWNVLSIGESPYGAILFISLQAGPARIVFDQQLAQDKEAL